MKFSTSFKAAWWLNNPHLQTIYPSLFRKIEDHHQSWRERMITPDNDFLDIDFVGTGVRPLVILIHGLAGSSQSGYIRGLQHVLDKQGFRSAALNFRGCSGELNNLARCYHSGDTDDIDFLYKTIRQREPDTAIAMVGFSLGGNALLKWLGEQGQSVDVFAACAVSVPFVLSACATKLDSGFSLIYRKNLIDELKVYMQDKHLHLKGIGNEAEALKIAQLGDLSKIKSFWQYDNQVVAKLYGFSGVDDYYQQSSSKQYLKAIEIPTLLIQSADDPFMTKHVIPLHDEISSSVSLEITAKGGHVGFVMGHNPFSPIYWLEQRIPDFLQLQLCKN